MIMLTGYYSFSHKRPEPDFHMTYHTEDCEYCYELQNGVPPRIYDTYTNGRSRLLHWTPDFRVWPSISPILHGHLLIVPTSHVKSFAQLTKEHRASLASLISHLQDKWYIGTQYIIFEHGVGLHEMGGCGISHAHLHILPVSPEQIDTVYKYFIQSVDQADDSGTCSSFDNFFDDCADNKSYIFVKAKDEKLLYVYSSKIPSQFLRKFMSRIVTGRDSDWRQLENRETFNSMTISGA